MTLVILIFCFNINLLADTRYIKSFRIKPTKTAGGNEKMELLKRGFQVEVLDTVKNWKKIEFNGKTGVDIREFTQSEQYTGPTKKGLRIPADKFEDFKSMINSIDTNDLKPQSAPQPQAEPAAADDDNSGIDESGLM